MPDDAHLVPGDEPAESVPSRGPAEPSLSLLLGASIDGENIDTKSGCSDERDKVGHSTTQVYDGQIGSTPFELSELFHALFDIGCELRPCTPLDGSVGGKSS